MTVDATRPRGRPSTPVLSPAKITRAAVTLVQTKGHRALTMAALAAHLHVAPSALYNHVPTKAVLLQLVQDYVNASVDAGGFATAPWPEALRAWARSYRDVYARHPPLVPLIAVTPVDGAPHTVAMYEAVGAGLRAGGWPQAAVVDVIVAVESFVLGSALDASAPADIFDLGADATARAPEFSAGVRARDAHDPARSAFELGLDALVDGLVARLARLR
ncbi:TetR/AcrR family transcriptional regulator [Kineococcus gynurae]|uniref:TetR/AcrR family transcriptional regulator n=1 Tax=Kineococcus gynurae TaxID=452979 RepID=A0ABV5LP76_9ACTN